MTRPSWLGRAARNRHRHAIEQASRRWHGGRRDDSARTRRKILISTQLNTPWDLKVALDGLVDDRVRGPDLLVLFVAEEREFRDAAPVTRIPREPGIRPIVAPPGDECYLLIRGIELLKLLHRHLYSYERSARRIKAWRLGGHVVIRQQRLP